MKNYTQNKPNLSQSKSFVKPPRLKKYTFKRLCKICGDLFSPPGKFHRYCPECLYENRRNRWKNRKGKV